MDYYNLWLDENVPAWNLSIMEEYDDGAPVDVWGFSRCEIFTGRTPIPVEIGVKGAIVDYNKTDFGAIIVSQRLGDVLSFFLGEAIQRIPVQLATAGKWEILNVLRSVDGIDHARSLIQYYPDNFPDKARAGTPRSVMKLRIREDRLAGQHLFRLTGWDVAIIASDALRQAILENSLASGLEFQLVT